jgi:hypothetical protein
MDPCIGVEILELRERIVLRNVYRLGNGGIDTAGIAALMRM